MLVVVRIQSTLAAERLTQRRGHFGFLRRQRVATGAAVLVVQGTQQAQELFRPGEGLSWRQRVESLDGFDHTTQGGTVKAECHVSQRGFRCRGGGCRQSLIPGQALHTTAPVSLRGREMFDSHACIPFHW